MDTYTGWKFTRVLRNDGREYKEGDPDKLFEVYSEYSDKKINMTEHKRYQKRYWKQDKNEGYLKEGHIELEKSKHNRVK
jgi:hypothetical protein